MDQIFTFSDTITPSAAAEVLTIQHPANSNKTFRYLSAYIYCSVACTVTLERLGTAATTTKATPVAANPASPTVNVSVANVFTTSNVGIGTVINTYNLAAGAWMSIDLGLYIRNGMFVSPAGVLDNLSLRSSSISGTITLQITWREL